MKKILAIALAAVLALSCMMTSVFAEEYVAYDNPAGDAVGVANPWEFFGAGDFWGPNADLDMTWEEIKPIIVAGGATYTIVYGGTPNAGSAPKVCFNFNLYNDAEINVPFAVTDNGDGTYTAVVALDDLVAAWNAGGMDLDHPDVAALLVQPWVVDFVLYSAVFNTGADAEVPAEDTPIVEEPTTDAPVAEEPVEDTPVEEEPAETGLALAVIPMIMAAAAIVVSKKR